ncbi:MAG: ABC transporter permease [Methanomassiliicoccus sp.]|nr:ABC transporter permease [Methanomassiliicoccus sp.]
MFDQRVGTIKAKGWRYDLERYALRFALGGMVIVAIAFISIPIASLFLRIDLQDFLASLSDPAVIDALWLSLLTATASTAIVLAFGTPIAYLNAHNNYWGRAIVDTITDIPAVLPPAVAGLALLMAFGRRGVLGQYFHLFGIDIAFTTTAVVLAQVFVASPFYIRQARISFQSVDSQFEDAARTMGSSRLRTFSRISLPLASAGLLSGAIMAWARALGEFGATIMFAGNMPGKTQTMPLAIYTSLEGDLTPALSISIILVAISFGVILAVKFLGRRMPNAS